MRIKDFIIVAFLFYAFGARAEDKTEVISPTNTGTTVMFYSNTAGEQHTLTVTVASGYKFVEGPSLGLNPGTLWSGSGSLFKLTDMEGKKEITATVKGKIAPDSGGGGEGGGEAIDFTVTMISRYFTITVDKPATSETYVGMGASADPAKVSVETTLHNAIGAPASGNVTFTAPIGTVVPSGAVTLAAGKALAEMEVTGTSADKGKIKASAADIDITDSEKAIGDKESHELTVVGVEFKEAAPNSGFDDSIDPHWIMVPKNGNNTAKVEITPSAAANKLTLESIDAGKATLSPSTASSSPQTITISGVAKGETEIKAKVSGSTSAGPALKVSVKKRLNKSVVIHAITEENDDVQAIPMGKGLAKRPCIASGTNGILDSSASGDDVVSGNIINTGLDGICQTAAFGDDVQLVAVGNGDPNTAGITKGTNAFRDTSTPGGDDVISGNDINTGPNGICDTAANTTNIVPTNVPSAAALESYLNDVYGKQTNVFFSVIRVDSVINYYLDRNGGVPDPPNQSEMNAISTAAASAGVAGNIYFVKVMDAPIATARPASKDAFIQSDTGGGSAVNVAAHELGHILGLSHNNSESVNLMHNTAPDGRQLQKNEWDILNP